MDLKVSAGMFGNCIYTVKNKEDILIDAPETTLYIVGNGFDRAHEVPSAYSDFRKFLRNHSLRKTLEDYIRDDALWWNFEAALAHLDTDMMAAAVPEMLDIFDAYDAEAQAADYFMAIDMAMSPADEIMSELPRQFRKWVNSLKLPSGRKVLEDLVIPGAKYLSFNYTEFMETLYQASGVCYIHGCRKHKNEKLILGHSYTEEIPDPDVRMPRYKEPYKRYMVETAYDTAMEHLNWYEEEMTKNSREIICAHKDFFSGLAQIQTIVVIGHSLSEVDMDYYAEILRQVGAAEKLRWIISCHDESGLKSIEAFAGRFGIASSQIMVFFL